MNEVHSAIVHIAFEEDSKATLSCILSSIRLHLKTVLKDTMKRRRLWLEAYSHKWREYLTNSHGSTSSVRWDNKDNIDEENDELIQEVDSLIIVEDIATNEYFIDLTDASRILWNYELLLHKSRDNDKRGGGSKCTSTPCCAELQEEKLIHMYHQLKPFRSTMNSNLDPNVLISLVEPAAHREQYWDRPLWAWSFEQILWANAIHLIWSGIHRSKTDEDQFHLQTGTGRDPKHMGIHVGVSRTKTLSRLPFIYHTRRSGLFSWVLIDPVLDEDVIAKFLRPLPLNRVLYPSNFALHKRALWALVVLERYGIQTVSDLLNLPHRVILVLLQKQLELVHSNQDTMEDYKETRSIGRCLSWEDLQGVQGVIEYLFYIVKGVSVQENPISSSFINNRNIYPSPSNIVHHIHDTNLILNEAMEIPTVTPSPQMPRIDSDGIDLNVFKQLPPRVRSEVRISLLQKRHLKKNGGTQRQAVLPIKRSLRSKPHCSDKAGKVCCKGTETNEIDSDGIDLTTLSQLPPQIRSEVRSSVLFNRSERSRISSLQQWLKKSG